MAFNRRDVLGGIAGAAIAAGTPAGRALAAAAPALPKAPVSITIMDVGGALALLQPGFDAYKAAKPELASRFVYVKAPAPELAGKIKAQQNAGKSDIDLVLTGSDGLAAGLDQGLWTKLFPTMRARSPASRPITSPRR